MKGVIQATVSMFIGVILLKVSHEVFWEVTEASSEYNCIDHGLFGWHSEACHGCLPDTLQFTHSFNYSLMTLEWVICIWLSFAGLHLITKVLHLSRAYMKDSPRDRGYAALPLEEPTPPNKAAHNLPAT